MATRVDVTSALCYRIAEKEVIPVLLSFYETLNGIQYDLKLATMSITARILPKDVREELVFYDGSGELVKLEYKIYRLVSALVSGGKLLAYDKETKLYCTKEVVN